MQTSVKDNRLKLVGKILKGVKYLWYMHRPVSVKENKTHKTLSGFNKQMDHQIITKRLDQV